MIMTDCSATLLVVDDDEMNRDLLSRRLMRKGYRVEMAEDGPHALNAIGRGGVDLVLLDVEMPEMSGLEALARIRELHTPLQMPVIMVTGRSDSKDVVEALNLGANDYITKPVDISVAAARITTHLSLKKMEESLRESEQRYALAAEGANDGLWDWDLQKNEIYFSSRWKSMLGFMDDEIGQRAEDWFDRVHPDDLEALRAKVQEHLGGESDHLQSEHRVLHRDRTYRWIVCRGLAVRDENGRAIRMAGSHRDVTLDRVVDPLTGLPNRLLFMDRLSYFLERAKRQTDCGFAVLSLGLDQFRAITDSLGYATGNKLLIGVAKRLELCVRAVDTLSHASGAHTVARISGDEFSILLDNIKAESNAVNVAKRLIADVEAPFLIEQQEIFCSACIGIVLNTLDSNSPEDLLHNAETALNRAQLTGRGCCQVFDTDMRNEALVRLQLESELRRAMEKRELQPDYQIIVSVKTGRIAGFETLIRWFHPLKGVILPSEFIPIAEETGLILEIDKLALRTACHQMRDWQMRFGDSLPEMICVNLSAKQFMAPGLAETVAEILKETDLNPRFLKLEITESAIVQDMESARTTLQNLRQMGVRVAIDDFGTGYCSLSYLQQFPVDTLKIDRTFVEQMENHDKLPAIVGTIISLAHGMGMDVIAEGVETAEQLRQLAVLGCEFAQGYYFGRPMRAEAVESILKMS